MKFGQNKCKLLISGRTTKIKSVQSLLQSEPELLTFYGRPVQTVEEQYVYKHIGVTQATIKQSQTHSLSMMCPLKAGVALQGQHASSMVYQTLSPTSSTPGGQTDGEPIAKKLSRTIGKMSYSMM